MSVPKVLPRAISYDRQTIDNPNPLARLAHRSRLRVALQLAARHTAPNGKLLDIGAGTGELLRGVGDMRPDIERIAFEPFMIIRYPGIGQVRVLNEIADGSADAVGAFEVFEHLTRPLLDECIAHARRILRPDGKLIVSVPIMEGLGLPAKELSRALLFRRRSDYRALDLVQGLVGRPVDRASDPLRSHKGFSHRAMTRRLDRDFVLVESLLSPFPRLPWWANSQMFCVYRQR